MNTTEIASPSKQKIERIFDQIAFRYDFLNTLLSFKLDEYWRRVAKDVVGDAQNVLDLGVGTGKFLKLFSPRRGGGRKVGVDFSQNMLRIAQKELPDYVSFSRADFHSLPFQPGSFDLVISSFTLRSVKDLPRFFLEIYETLSQNGRAVFLCLTRPKGLFYYLFYYPYLKFYIPFVGKRLSKSADAYDFLSHSIQAFQEPHATIQMLRASGFQTIQIRQLTFGSATMIIAKK